MVFCFFWLMEDTTLGWFLVRGFVRVGLFWGKGYTVGSRFASCSGVFLHFDNVLVVGPPIVAKFYS